MKERIDLLESNYKKLEQNEAPILKEETNKNIDVISKRLDKLESSVFKNQESIEYTETEHRELKNSWTKEKDSFKKNICDDNVELGRYSLKIKCEMQVLNRGYMTLMNKFQISMRNMS